MVVASKDAPKTFAQKILAGWRSALMAGLLALAPIAITFAAFVYLVRLSDGLVSILPHAWQPEQILGFPIPGLGIVVAVVFISLVGLMTRNYIGKKAVRGLEYLFERVPVVRGVYNSIKQLSDTLLTPKEKSIHEVVIIEYPRKGIWCFAFLTNDNSWALDVNGKPLINLFLPSTPNPTTGFYLLVPVEDVYRVDIKTEQAVKLIMSAGIVSPDNQLKLTPFMPPNQTLSPDDANPNPTSAIDT
ncbi:MAG: DUF502 domain-containing protein [Myxococcota bacterium]|nr:DUF502 domain-containing protein [Myxococcota bacterium]